MMQMFLVFIGGGLGASTRFAISLLLKESTFPWATLVSNVLASFILGLLTYFVLRDANSDSLRLFAIVGFCGGFSTFSSFSYDNIQLLKSGQYGAFFLYSLGSVLLCMAVILLAYHLMELVFQK